MENIKALIEKVEQKANTTSSTTEACKYILALVAIEECVFSISPALSRKCKEAIKKLMNR